MVEFFSKWGTLVIARGDALVLADRALDASGLGEHSGDEVG